MNYMLYMYIEQKFFNWKKKIHIFLPPALIGEFFYPVDFLSRINDYIEPMGEIYSTKCFCNASLGGLGKTIVQQKFSTCMVHVYYM